MAEDLYDWTEAEADNLGTGRSAFAFRVVNNEGRGTSVFWLHPDGRVEFAPIYVREAAGEEVKRRLFEALAAIPSFASVRAEMKFPSVTLQQPLGDSEMAAFQRAVLEVKTALRRPATT